MIVWHLPAYEKAASPRLWVHIKEKCFRATTRRLFEPIPLGRSFLFLFQASGPTSLCGADFASPQTCRLFSYLGSFSTLFQPSSYGPHYLEGRQFMFRRWKAFTFFFRSFSLFFSQAFRCQNTRNLQQRFQKCFFQRVISQPASYYFLEPCQR